ncbi:glycosyltransferase [Actinobacteria bacterium YIM 96077]|uniref:Glycosyl transferase family 1 n=1 Tax=Phytoactinopolyspora halophila TaxID=1981511 RepID=A0A329QG13_9ACTN|nr:glycosyltransferase [Phytoactinopolyspora halophila]AYY14021.1 glycosyltransferase [Actinobacteria bacterium YIM 96077]RAW10272.1 glycosyl transferase family 1 [Phytoactinopolyspora halophila]
MVRLIEPEHHLSLGDYEAVAHLGAAVSDLRHEAESLRSAVGTRRVWMVNSTPRGGGVAEMLPPLINLMSELGVDARWLVMQTDEPDFFRLTKRVHNLVQGHGEPEITEDERGLYEKISYETAEAISEYLEAGDVLVVHDPQPLAAGALIRQELGPDGLVAIWRCHIGLDEHSPQTRTAWDFLCPYTEPYDHAVFSAPEYIPGCLSGKSTIIHPGIDPLSHKNRELPVHKIVGILSNGGLTGSAELVPSPSFDHRAKRLQPDGSWAAATEPEDFGLLYRPIVSQVSRWDRLKGYVPLLRGFSRFKETLGDLDELDELPRRTLERVGLVLAGPDPTGVSDDPEAHDVLDEIRQAYMSLSPEIRESIAVITLPMASAKENALIVNALHRCSDIVVQNSLQEGFGLTATEAMWKQTAVITSEAAGLRQQVRPGLDGHTVRDAEDPDAIAGALHAMLRDQKRRELLGHNAQQRVYSDFLIFTQIRSWLELIVGTLASEPDG